MPDVEKAGTVRMVSYGYNRYGVGANGAPRCIGRSMDKLVRELPSPPSDPLVFVDSNVRNITTGDGWYAAYSHTTTLQFGLACLGNLIQPA